MGNKIEQAAERLSRETGIDFKKYRKPELVEKISDLIGFTGQAGGIMFRRYAVLLVIVIGLCVWFYTQKMSLAGIILFFVVGLLFTAAAGTALGTKKVTEKAIDDSAGVVTLMLDFVKEIKQDLFSLAKNKAGAKTAVSDLVKGVSYGVFIPTVKQIVREKLSILAKPVVFVIEHALFYFTKSIASVIDNSAGDAAGKKPEEKEAQTKEEDDKAFVQSIDAARETVASLADSVNRKATIPSKVMLIIALVVGLPILFIIYKIFSA